MDTRPSLDPAIAMRAYIGELEETVRQLKEQLVPSTVFPAELGLKPLENKIVAVLLARSPSVVSRARLMDAAYFGEEESPGDKIIAQLMCHLRPKLAPYGVAVQSRPGFGWAFDKGAAEILRAMLQGEVRRIGTAEDGR